MAHFYGTLQGARGLATRCGTKASAIEVVAASWDGAFRVTLEWDDSAGCNRYTISEIAWQGRGRYRTVESGLIGLGAEGGTE